MSTLLLVMTPFALLAIVSSLCFVGCVLDSGPFPPDGTEGNKYSDDTVLADEDRLSAYWRLNETSGPTAVNAANPGTADGKYLSQEFIADPEANSAEAHATLLFGQAGLLQGDLVPPHTAGSPRQPCIYVDGGYVSVDWDTVIAPSEAEGFTIEAWVRVGWGNKDLDFDRAVVGALESTGGYKGFGILAGKDQTWKAFVGNGVDVTFVTGAAVDLDKTYHLVATYAAGTLTLYVNGSSSATSATYVPTTGVGAPDIPSRLFIGAGGTHSVDPKIPFVGKVQCVALYRGAFSDADVQKHLNDGNAA